jgi:hypothetical protein
VFLFKTLGYAELKNKVLAFPVNLIFLCYLSLIDTKQFNVLSLRNRCVDLENLCRGFIVSFNDIANFLNLKIKALRSFEMLVAI